MSDPAPMFEKPQHMVAGRVGIDGLVRLVRHPSYFQIVAEGVGVCKTGPGRFVLTLPASPPKAMLFLETVPATSINIVGRSATRKGCRDGVDTWEIAFDALEVDWEAGVPTIARTNPHDSAFDFMLLWSDE